MEYVVETSVRSVLQSSVEYTRCCIIVTLWQYIATLFSVITIHVTILYKSIVGWPRQDTRYYLSNK